MKYVEVEDAIDLPGLRLVLSAGVPGPWGEAAKGIFGVKRIPYTPVRQRGGLENEALRRWTGQDNAPIAVYQSERPRSAWTDILFLAERLAPEPSLLPADPAERAQMFGLAHEIFGEQGFVWCRRLTLIDGMLGAADPPLPEPIADVARRLGRKYGYSDAAARNAPARVKQILELLGAQLHAQRERGSGYLIGNRLSAVDIIWAAAAAMIEPLPPEHCAMPEPLRAGYLLVDPETKAAADPALLEHRDRIYRDHLTLPLDF